MSAASTKASGDRTTQGGPDIGLAGLRIFAGPSLLSRAPVVCLHLTCDSAEVPDLSGLKALEDRLLSCLRQQSAAAKDQVLPAFSEGDDGGRSGPRHLSGMMAWAAVQLQRLLDFDVWRWSELPQRTDGLATAAFEYQDGVIADLAGRAAAELMSAGLREDGQHIGVAEILAVFLEAASRKSVSHIGMAIMREAALRSIPCRRLLRDPQRLLVGQGCKLQRFHKGYTDHTAFVGTRIATNKYLAASMFRSHGLPAPRNALVRDEAELPTVVSSLDYPLVVKPNEGDFGTAVTLQIEDQGSLERAFALARKHGPALVEEQIAGDNHRLLVMHDKVVSVVRQRPAHVVGDGESSIAGLIERENADRTDSLSDQMKKITVDEELLEVLSSQSLALDDRPAPGQEVLLRRHSNLSRGGTNVNVTDSVHRENRAMAERAARVVGLDLAGIDFITTDITKPFYETGGAICEINPMPGWIMGDGPNLAGALFDRLFPPADQGRIPIVAVLGGERGTRVAETAAVLFGGEGRSVGVATSETLMVRDHCVARGDFSGEAGGCLLLADPAVEVAVQALTPDRAAEQGLGFDLCSVAVLVGSDPASEPETVLQNRIGALLASLAQRLVVVLARDPNFAALRRAAGKTPVCLVSGDPDGPVTRQHCDAGGQALLYTRDGPDAQVTLWRGETSRPLCRVPAVALDDDALVDLACVCGAALGGGLTPTGLQEAVTRVGLEALAARPGS